MLVSVSCVGVRAIAWPRTQSVLGCRVRLHPRGCVIRDLTKNTFTGSLLWAGVTALTRLANLYAPGRAAATALR